METFNHLRHDITNDIHYKYLKGIKTMLRMKFYKVDFYQNGKIYTIYFKGGSRGQLDKIIKEQVPKAKILAKYTAYKAIDSNAEIVTNPDTIKELNALNWDNNETDNETNE